MCHEFELAACGLLDTDAAQVFGAAPTVGIMNPIAAKKPANGGQPQMRVVQQSAPEMSGS